MYTYLKRYSRYEKNICKLICVSEYQTVVLYIIIIIWSDSNQYTSIEIATFSLIRAVSLQQIAADVHIKRPDSANNTSSIFFLSTSVHICVYIRLNVQICAYYCISVSTEIWLRGQQNREGMLSRFEGFVFTDLHTTYGLDAGSMPAVRGPRIRRRPPAMDQRWPRCSARRAEDGRVFKKITQLYRQSWYANFFNWVEANPRHALHKPVIAAFCQIHVLHKFNFFSLHLGI